MSAPAKVKQFLRNPMLTESAPLILASASRYRAELLQRLRLPFVAIASQVDETPLAGESVEMLVHRLAMAKAEALARQHPGRWVLGSDQSAALGAQTLGKSGHHAAAVAQLLALSGRSVDFFTAVALVCDGRRFEALDVTTVRFRALQLAEIERYLALEPAYDCAGSFKCEGLGISLFEEIRSSDPTGLVGLPLIASCRLFAQAGIEIPGSA